MSSEVPAQWALPLEILLCILQNLDHVGLRRCLRINREIHAAICTGESFRRTLFRSRVISPDIPLPDAVELHPIFTIARIIIICDQDKRILPATFEHLQHSRALANDMFCDDLATQPPIRVLGIGHDALPDFKYTEVQNETGVTVGDVVQNLRSRLRSYINSAHPDHPRFFRENFCDWSIYKSSDLISRPAMDTGATLEADIGICFDPRDKEFMLKVLLSSLRGDLDTD